MTTANWYIPFEAINLGKFPDIDGSILTAYLVKFHNPDKGIHCSGIFNSKELEVHTSVFEITEKEFLIDCGANDRSYLVEIKQSELNTSFNEFKYFSAITPDGMIDQFALRGKLFCHYDVETVVDTLLFLSTNYQFNNPTNWQTNADTLAALVNDELRGADLLSFNSQAIRRLSEYARSNYGAKHGE